MHHENVRDAWWLPEELCQLFISAFKLKGACESSQSQIVFATDRICRSSYRWTFISSAYFRQVSDPQRNEFLHEVVEGVLLCGLDCHDLAHILDTFEVLKRNELNSRTGFGGFRTKRLCLEAHDRFIGDGQALR